MAARDSVAGGYLTPTRGLTARTAIHCGGKRQRDALGRPAYAGHETAIKVVVLRSNWRAAGRCEAAIKVLVSVRLLMALLKTQVRAVESGREQAKREIGQGRQAGSTPSLVGQDGGRGPAVDC